MIFDHILTWDTISIQKSICDHLEKLSWNIKNSMGFDDLGKSAFIIEARKKKFVIIINLENDEKQIRIKAGTDGKYLPKGKQVPKYSKIFPHTKVSDASNYFEKILEDLK